MIRTETLGAIVLFVDKNLGTQHGTKRTKHGCQIGVTELGGQMVNEEVGTLRSGELFARRTNWKNRGVGGGGIEPFS